MNIDLIEQKTGRRISIKKLNPKPNDVFVLKMKRNFGDEPMLDKFGKSLREAAGGEIVLIILDEDSDLAMLTDEQLNKVGLYRKQDS